MGDGNYIILFLIMRGIFGTICALVAQSKGRSALGWFVGGFFIVLIGLIIVACLPNLREQKELARVQDDTNRRLREQLRQEQMKIEALRAHTVARLDAHDGALRLDTRNAAPALQGPAPPGYLENSPPGPPQAMTPRDDGTQWFYNDESAGQQGPMSIFGLRSAIVKGMIVHATLVWHEGMGNWTPASQIEKIARMLPNAQS